MHFLKCKPRYSIEGIITQVLLPHIHPGLFTHIWYGSGNQPEPTPKRPRGCIFTTQVLTQNTGHDYAILSSQNDSKWGSQAGMLLFKTLLRCLTVNPVLLTLFVLKTKSKILSKCPTIWYFKHLMSAWTIFKVRFNNLTLHLHQLT